VNNSIVFGVLESFMAAAFVFGAHYCCMGCMDIFSLCVCCRIWRRWRLVFMKDHEAELMKAASNDGEQEIC
jgi:hypothetical protein